MLVKWFSDGDEVVLVYSNGGEVRVMSKDFDRAFGAILNSSKEDVIRDFAVSHS